MNGPFARRAGDLPTAAFRRFDGRRPATASGSLLRGCFLIGLCMTAGLAVSRSAAAQSAVWELTPYRVQVYAVAADAPGLSPRATSDLLQRLQDRADAALGAAWQLNIEPAPAELAALMRVRLGELQRTDLPAEALAFDFERREERFHKVLLLRIDRGLAGLAFAAREYDAATQTLGHVSRRDCPQAGLDASTALSTLLDAFRPLATIEEVQPKTAAIRLRAAGLAVQEPELLAGRPGDLFVPVIRSNLPDGDAKDIRAIDWTYLLVDEVQGAQLNCRIFTGLRSPLSARRRGRTQQLAIAVRPKGGETTLRLATGAEQLPLRGYDVFAYGPDSPKTTLLGQTDREGRLTVGPGETPLRLLLIRSGGEFIARLPIVPGLSPEMVAQAPDDEQRLAVEGFISGVQEEVLETIVQREVFLAQIRKRLEENNADAARKLMERLRALTDRKQYQDRLTTYRNRIFTNDPRRKARIDKLFSDTYTLLDKYLDPRPVDELAAQLSGS